MYTKAAEVWFQIVSGLPGVAYLTGLPSARLELAPTCDALAIPHPHPPPHPHPDQARYELAPTCDAVARCLGVLLGEPSVQTPAQLAAFWTSQVQPGRQLRLEASSTGERMHLLERHEESGDEVCTLEFVMSTRLNHAFVVHHWRPPSWHRRVALLAVQQWPEELPRARADTPPLAAATDGRASVPRLALYPALLQPLLSEGAPLPSSPPCSEAEPSGATEEQLRLGEADRSRRRLLLLSCDPSKEGAIAFSVRSILDGAPTPQDEQLVARVLALTEGGLAAAEDDTLLAIAAAVSRTHNPALRHAALLHAPLAVPTAVLCGVRSASSALASLSAALVRSPVRCGRLALRAATRLCHTRPSMRGGTDKTPARVERKGSTPRAAPSEVATQRRQQRLTV